MHKNKMIAAVTVSLVLGVGTYFGGKFVRAKQEGLSHLAVLTETNKAHAVKLFGLYSKRLDLLKKWSGKTSLPEPMVRPRTVEEFRQFDVIQNEISEKISQKLVNPTTRTSKPVGLERLEESINFARRDYHDSALAIELLAKKYRKLESIPPSFEAERVLREILAARGQ